MEALATVFSSLFILLASKLPQHKNVNVAKRKRMTDAVLLLDINFAKGIDQGDIDPRADRRTYQVHGWVEPHRDFKTQEAYGPDPEWWSRHYMPVETVSAERYLNLEVVRTRYRSNPGTSSGIILVGSTQVPLPRKTGEVVLGKVALVRQVFTNETTHVVPETIAAGYLSVVISMIAVQIIDP